MGGYFRFRFDRLAPRLHYCWNQLSLFVAVSAFPTEIRVCSCGGSIFQCRRTFALALFEEVALVRGLRRLGRFVPLREPIFVDPRRWHRDGWWRRTWINRNLGIAFARGVTPDKLAARYRSKTN